MRSVIVAMALLVGVVSAVAQSLTLEQQATAGDLITKDAGVAIPAGSFTVAIDSTVPEGIALRPVPKAAQDDAPSLRGKSYVVVDEVIGIVDLQTRKITAVMQRVRKP